MEAIIYMPGLEAGMTDQTIETFAHRIKKARDINAEDKQLKYSVEIKQVTYGTNQTTKVASIYEQKGDVKDLVYDIYEFNYNKSLTSRFESRNVISQAMLLLVALKRKSLQIITTRKGLSPRDKFQSFYAWSIMLCLAVFSFSVISSIAVVAANNISWPELPCAIDWICEAVHWMEAKFKDRLPILKAYSAYASALFAVVLVFLPGLNDLIKKVAIDFLCLIYYFDSGERKLTITGRFEELLEFISESESPEYKKVSIYSYSFGSILALDILYPRDGRVSRRIASNVHTLVTIGCPYDFIRVYWKKYYVGRRSSEMKLALDKWYNIYSSADVLSSNFRDDAELKESQKSIVEGGLKPTNVPFNVIDSGGIINTVMLSGFRAHSMYWDPEPESASCFSDLFQVMYPPAPGIDRHPAINLNKAPDLKNDISAGNTLSQEKENTGADLNEEKKDELKEKESKDDDKT